MGVVILRCIEIRYLTIAGKRVDLRLVKRRTNQTTQIYNIFKGLFGFCLLPPAESKWSMSNYCILLCTKLNMWWLNAETIALNYTILVIQIKFCFLTQLLITKLLESEVISSWIHWLCFIFSYYIDQRFWRSQDRLLSTSAFCVSVGSKFPFCFIFQFKLLIFNYYA